jgi:hypothetical protein
MILTHFFLKFSSNYLEIFIEQIDLANSTDMMEVREVNIKEKNIFLIMFEKLVNFLKNKHKFDHKLEMRDQLEIFDNLLKNFNKAVESDLDSDIKPRLAKLFVELIKYSNLRKYDVMELLNSELKTTF